MDAAPVVRSRFGGSKVRTGCITCKSRHVKCDESRPGCQRCAKAKRVCGGYDTLSSTSAQDGCVKFFIYTPSPPRNLKPLPNLSSEESKCFAVFKTCIANGLAGPFSLDFWSGNLLQIAHHEPAVMDAIVAVGSLHGYFERLHTPHTSVNDYALRHYSKSIRRSIDLNVKNTSENVQIVLAISILLSAFETLRGHYKAGMMHISSGINVLMENDCTLTSSQRRDFGLVFTRLGNQLAELGEGAGLSRSLLVQEALVRTPGTFASLNHALETFEVMLNQSLRWLAMIDATAVVLPMPERPVTLSQFDDWCLAFDNSHFDPKQLGVSILHTNREMLGLLLRYPSDGDEMVWDLFKPQFERILYFAELCTSSAEGRSKPTFTFSLGILAPLYFTSTRCRDPVIRRRALGVLHTCNRKEGIWDSLIAVRAAERIVAVEESSVMAPIVFAEQIPEHARVKDLEIVFGEGRQAQIKYRTGGFGAEGAVTYRSCEIVEW